MEIFKKFKNLLFGTIGMIIFGAIGITILGLIITSVVNTVDKDPVMYIDEDCKECVNRYAPVWRGEHDCESGYVGQDDVVLTGTKVVVKTSIPNDPDECVRILAKEGIHKGKVAWIPYKFLAKSED